MARAEIPVVALGPQGTPAGGASVQINVLAGGAATVYAARSGATTLANPLTADAYGNVAGYVERGTYVAVITYLANPPYSVEFDAAPAADGSIDELWLPDGIVTGAKLAAAIKDAAAGVSSTRKLGTGATDAAAGDHSHSALQPRQARVTRSTTQLIPNAAITPVQFTAEAFDLPADNQHDNVTNNTRLTCVEAGFYTIGATWQWSTASLVGSRIAYIYHGATQIGEDWRPGGQIGGMASAADRLAVGDIVELRVWEDSGVTAGLNLALAALWWVRGGA